MGLVDSPPCIYCKGTGGKALTYTYNEHKPYCPEGNYILEFEYDSYYLLRRKGLFEELHTIVKI